MTYVSNENPSPFPSAADMDLDMWKASDVIGGDHTRMVDCGDDHVCKVYGTAHNDPTRDATARRIDMVGDLYEALRMLVDQAKVAGVDVTPAEALLTEFVSPKPFSEQP